MLSHIIAVVHAMLIDVSNSVSRHVVSFILPWHPAPRQDICAVDIDGMMEAWRCLSTVWLLNQIISASDNLLQLILCNIQHSITIYDHTINMLTWNEYAQPSLPSVLFPLLLLCLSVPFYFELLFMFLRSRLETRPAKLSSNPKHGILVMHLTDMHILSRHTW